MDPSVWFQLEVCSWSCFSSTRAACQAAQWPLTRAQRLNADTYTTECTQPVAMLIGIMMIHATVSQPFSRRINVGSPWIIVQRDLITGGASYSMVAAASLTAPQAG